MYTQILTNMTELKAHKYQTLEGRVAIVTGGSRGIGEGIVLDLLTRGANVCTTFSSESSIPLCEELQKKASSLSNGAKLIYVQADVSVVESAEKVLNETIKAFGDHIDILVNNAAVLISPQVIETTREDFDKVFHTNVLGPILLSKAVIPHLRHPGRIISISSVSGRIGYPGLVLYGASKSALEGFTRNMAFELGDKGTTVNCIAPGGVQSKMLDDVPDEIKNPQKDRTPIQNRFGEAQEIADAVAYLAGPESSWVTGQTISLSGGFVMN